VSKPNGVRVVQALPGWSAKCPGWVKSANGTVEDLNLIFAKLRNIDIEIAQQEQVRVRRCFLADAYRWSGGAARYGTNYAIAARMACIRGAAGQTIYGLCFFEELGLDGEIAPSPVESKKGQYASL